MLIDEYREYLRTNESIIKRLMYEPDGAYPCLTKHLCLYQCSLGNKLLNLLGYFLSYGNGNEKQPISNHPHRGIEMYASLQKLVNKYGSDKRRWHKNINIMLAYGLLNEYVLPTDKEYADKKFSNPYFSPTEQNLYSLTVAINSAHKPVKWYHVPRYTEELLSEADERAKMFEKYGTNCGKNAVRDVLGVEVANSIFDSGYGISKRTNEIRNVLKECIVSEIEKNGFTSTEELIQKVFETMKPRDMFEAWKKGERIVSPGYIEQTWREYSPMLFEEFHLKQGRPTKEEKERWNLKDDRHIIRRKCLTNGAE